MTSIIVFSISDFYCISYLNSKINLMYDAVRLLCWCTYVCVCVRACDYFKSSLACFAWQWIFVTFTFSAFLLMIFFFVCTYIHIHGCVNVVVHSNRSFVILFRNHNLISISQGQKWCVVCGAPFCVYIYMCRYI